MNRIHFKNVVPNVFSERKELNSDVWANDITFEKDKLYLVEADSGKGKSTFCSYIVGYRHDYTGHVYFDDADTIDFIDNSIGYMTQEIVWQMRPVRRHEVDGFYCAQ